jgi:hypothetical protein
MIIGSGMLDIGELEPDLRQALLDACAVVVDEAFNSLEMLADDETFADTPMASWLPRTHLLRYDAGFARRFAACLIAVAGKLTDRHPHVLASVAEEMALAAILDEAEAILEMDGIQADMRAEAEGAFQDTDFESLFDPRWDGVEDAEEVAHLAMANLSFTEWFRPFRDEIPVHPYVAEE